MTAWPTSVAPCPRDARGTERQRARHPTVPPNGADVHRRARSGVRLLLLDPHQRRLRRQGVGVNRPVLRLAGPMQTLGVHPREGHRPALHALRAAQRACHSAGHDRQDTDASNHYAALAFTVQADRPGGHHTAGAAATRGAAEADVLTVHTIPLLHPRTAAPTNDADLLHGTGQRSSLHLIAGPTLCLRS